MSISIEQQAMSALLAADRDGPLLALPEALRPQTLAQAYAIQDAVVGAGTAIGGWKVAPAKPGLEPRCAPIPLSRFHASGSRVGAEVFRAPEFEIELAVEMGRDLPPRDRPYGTDDLVAAIAGTRAAIEVICSRFVDRKAVSMLEALADAQSNAGVVAGPELSGWSGLDCANVAMSVRVNGATVRTCAGGPSTDEVLGALVWLANHAAPRNGGLKAGQIIITGARISPFPVRPGDRVVATVEGVGTVEMEIAAAN
jgi:2-keto-4-pentenoate hydratase